MKKTMIICFTIACCALQMALAAEQQVRLATTTSTYNSGLLDSLLDAYTVHSSDAIQIISVGTGAALKLGQSGDVDLVLVHAQEAADAFISAGWGVNLQPVMYNDFVIVGPVDDPAGIQKTQEVVHAFQLIQQTPTAVFLSRGDDSGTHLKENTLWAAAGIDVPFKHYRSVGQGMGKTLLMADELAAYTLTDRGTWLAMAEQLQLTLLFPQTDQVNDILMLNPYQMITVNPAVHAHVNHTGAQNFSSWLMSDEGQDLIDTFRVQGQALFKTY